MPTRSSQDIYARHLVSTRGYPLWMPEASHQLLMHRPGGLKIGDVGVVIPEDGCFDVFFNICLPADHPFHRATGVPNNFTPIKLTDMDTRTVLNAENPGCILANSSVKSVSTIERSAESSSGTRSTGLEYEFSLSSSEGALLILPEGAQRHDLRNHHCFLELATQHGAEWYRFAQEKVGQIVGNNSLYLITGFYKTTSWAVAAFEKTTGTAEYPAQFRVAQPGGDDFTATYAWNTMRGLEWHAGPINRCDQPNQTVFIRGFKVALRTGMFGARWISVKADTPSTQLNPARSIARDSRLAYIFGGLSSSSRATQASGSNVQGQVATNSALEGAQNEIQNNRALAVGEHVIIQRIPEASQAFHPSDVINEYLLNKEPSANIAVTHDDVWTTMLEEGLLRPEDSMQDGRLETLVSQKYDVISERGAVYLQSRNESVVSKIYESEELDRIAGSSMLSTPSIREMATRASEPSTSAFLSEEEIPSYDQACSDEGDTAGSMPEDKGERFIFNGAIPANVGPRRRNVVLFGQAGAGKSSIINLLADSDVAKTSSGLRGCTLDATEYSFTFPGGKQVSIFDTVGLEEPEIGINAFFGAIAKAHQLIKDLYRTGGIDLLVFCVRAGRVISTMQQNYRLFFEVLCGGRVPLAIVVTNLEQEDVMEDWWARNEGTFDQYRIHSVGHACITSVPGHVQAYARKRAESKTVLRKMLLNALVDANTPYTKEERSWFGAIVDHLKSFVSKGWTPTKKELSKKLEKDCGFRRDDAEKLAQMLVAKG